MSTQGTAERGTPAAAGGAVLTWLACLVALLVAAGSVYLSVAGKDAPLMDPHLTNPPLKACPLCFYQRTFVFAVLAVLAVGLIVGTPRAGLSLLALPLAVGGLGVAAFHVYLELNGTLECPRGLAGIGSAPQQSLAGMGILTLVLTLAVLTSGAEKTSALVGLFGTVLLGAVLAGAAVLSSPPLPPKPTRPYPPNTLDVCRRPFTSTPTSP